MFFFEKMSASRRSVLSTLRKCQEARLVLKNLVFETQISAEIQVQTSNIGLIRMLSSRGELIF